METTLDRIGVGRRATVVLAGISGETPKVTTQRLLHQGIVTGAVVDVIRRTTGGGRILAVGQSRIALDPQILRGIVVVEGEPGHFPRNGEPLSHSGVDGVDTATPRSDHPSQPPDDEQPLSRSEHPVARDREAITSLTGSTIASAPEQHHRSEAK
jgi:Fe2+ transport system protein FeoA